MDFLSVLDGNAVPWQQNTSTSSPVAEEMASGEGRSGLDVGRV